MAGAVAAFAVTRLSAGLLVNVSATDLLIVGGAALFLAVVALAASHIPAMRATRIDPNVALHCQRSKEVESWLPGAMLVTGLSLPFPEISKRVVFGNFLAAAFQAEVP